MKTTSGRRKAAELNTPDLYQQVTDKIIVALENGVPPWRRPWRSAEGVHGSSLPVNAVTGRAYSGINVPLLWMAAEEHGYASDRWITFRQAKDAGGYVRKGETSALAIIYKPFEKQARDSSDNLLFRDGEPVMEQLAMIKQLQLFSVHQCEGLPESVTGTVAHTAPTGQHSYLSAVQLKQVQQILSATCVGCDHRRQDRAYYRPGADRIVMPTAPQFLTEADYWSTLLHELVHATGHGSRLNREGITSSSRQFGDPVYAFEELIAETGSAFLCAQLGITGDVQHESYLAGWLRALREDKRAIFRACRFAREASEYLLEPLNRNTEQAA
ncbi:ArdC family protein [Pantoea rwandensis]|uniref:DNA primase n=1 Tax=Pantoea rwandensis TaxID=1076550 RepID=A0ABM5RNU3_9GAMM|nr:zincin-like metallopeptidase domain-containing protein [Pantoea rwandensis]AIR87668.1 DNA primase [Pantoea rwandensis]